MGEAFFNHEWDFPAWPYVEPLKDIQADSMEIATTLNSPRRVAARRNLDFETIVQEKCADEEKLISCAMQVAEKINNTPYVQANPDERVTWREVAHPQLGNGLQMQILDKNSASSNERSEKETASNQSRNGSRNGRMNGRRVAA